MRTGRPKAPLMVTVEQQETLERWTGRPTTAQALAQRARLVLLCAEGKGNTEVERVLTLTLEMAPSGATHWSTRSMAERAGLTQSAVSRIWRAFALQPHRTEAFQLSKDPLFIEGKRLPAGVRV